MDRRQFERRERKNNRTRDRKSDWEDRKNHADLIERSIIEGSTQQRQRQESSSTNSYQSRNIDKLLQNENNDWFFEKILEKFEDLRSKKVTRHERSSSNDFDGDQTPYGVERIIERRYYVKKPRLAPRRNQLTSTSDLTTTGSKNRLHSGVSTFTAATTVCSQCQSTTPTYVEDLRDQSDTLRNEISGLKNEIEQLQVSQQEFFQQLEKHFQAKSTATPPISTQTPTPTRNFLSQSNSAGNLPVPISTGRKSRSISTQSQHSSSSSESTTTSVESPTKPNTTSSNAPVARVPFISEFVATKNPSIAPAPTPDTVSSSKLSSKAPSPPVNGQFNSKLSSIAPSPPVSDEHISSESSSSSSSSSSSRSSTPPINSKPLPIPSSSVPYGQSNSKLSSTASTPLFTEQNNSKPPSIASTPLVNAQVNIAPVSNVSNSLFNGQTNSKPPSTASTPVMNVQINPGLPPTIPTPLLHTQVNSNPPSTAPTPSVNEYVNFKPASMAFRNVTMHSGPAVAGSMESIHSRNSSVVPAVPAMSSSTSSTRVPIYENELAYRRVLSPRSQIVASSGSIPDSSDSSSGTVSPELIATSPRKDLKVPPSTLHAKDLNDLVQYSSQLQLSGFRPSLTPVITNPNHDSSFWNSVDQYIEGVKSNNINIGLPPIPRPMNPIRTNFNPNTTKQLDKYDLEIKPQEFIEFSAPLLMPPLDILP